MSALHIQQVLLCYCCDHHLTLAGTALGPVQKPSSSSTASSLLPLRSLSSDSMEPLEALQPSELFPVALPPLLLTLLFFESDLEQAEAEEWWRWWRWW